MVLSYKVSLLRGEDTCAHPLVHHAAQPWDLLFIITL